MANWPAPLPRIARYLLRLLIIGACISLVRSTHGQGTDFLVFWKAGRALIEGQPVYALNGYGMVFKYPPWIAPWFIPISLFSFETAKWIWGVFCLSTLFGVIYVLERYDGVKRISWIVPGVLYWGLLAIHFLDGQVILPLLFLGLVATTSLPYFFTTKIFTVFPILVFLKRFWTRKTVFISAVLTLVFLMITVFASYHGSVRETLQAWITSASSGGTLLPEYQVRGPKNQSLTSLACRLIGISPSHSIEESLLACFFYAIMGMLIFIRRKFRTERELWFIALAITPVFHPLPWQHLYLWTFPLAVYALDRIPRAMNQRVWYGVSLFLITLSNGRAIGSFGYLLENAMGRAWGTLLLVLFMLWQSPSLEQN